MVALLVQKLHGALEAGLQGGFVLLEQPHHNAPAHCRKQVIAVTLLNKPYFSEPSLRELSHFAVEQRGESNGYPAEEIKHDLVVDSRLLAENESAEEHPRKQVVQRGRGDELVEQFIACLVGEHEEAEVFAVLDGHGTDVFEKGRRLLEGDIAEEQGHHKSMDEADLAAVLDTVAEALEESEELGLEVRHSCNIRW